MSPEGGGTGGAVPVALALGSNLGSRLESLRFARRELDRWIRGLRCSRVYETEPLGPTGQPRFLNACCVGRTTLRPERLLERCRSLERAAGRTAGGPRYRPRPLDIDLLLYGAEVIRRDELQVPHPRMTERAFVLVPLSEVAGDWRLPTTGETVAALAARVSGEPVEPYEGNWG